MTDLEYSSDAPQGLGRRTLLIGAAWSVPVVSVMTSTSAFATSTDRTVTAGLSTGNSIPASGAATLTATVRNTGAAPFAGEPVTLTGPASATFVSATGTTDGAGQFSTNVDLNTRWAVPGSTVTFAALSTGAVGTVSPTVLGSNILGVGGSRYGSALVQTELVFPSPVVDAKSADTFAIALLQDGTVWAIGDNSKGQLGVATPATRTEWAAVPGVTDAVAIAVGRGHGFALLSDGHVLAWGANESGQLGDGTTATARASVAPVSNLADVKKVVSGGGNGWALKTDGTVWTWGYNHVGQLGNGSQQAIAYPDAAAVANISGATGITSSNWTCIVQLSDGSYVGWGENRAGQLGDGSTTIRDTPVAVLSGINNVVKLVGGRETFYALLSDGTVLSWGANDHGQVGNGGTTNALSPTSVTGLAHVVDVNGVGRNGFAVLSDGTVKGWGWNSGGQIGDGTSGNDRTTPVTVNVPAGTGSISLLSNAGYDGGTFFGVRATVLSLSILPTMLAAGADGTVTALVLSGSKPVSGRVLKFSADSNAGLSATSGTTDANGTASVVVTPSPWTTPGATLVVSAISDAGEARQSLTVTGSNVLGVGGAYGGGLKQTERVFPSPVVEAMSGQGFSIVRLQDGTVWTVGENGLGQLGDGTTTTRSTWAAVSGISDVVSIAVGIQHVLALTSDGSVWAWGDGQSGQIGDGSTGGRTSPVRVPNLSGVTQVQAGGTNSYVLKSDGTVWAWGYNHIGQLGNGTAQAAASPSPTQVKNISTGSLLLAANWTIFVQLNDGSYVAWGQNNHGQIGDGTTTDRSLPTAALSGLTGIKKLAFGRDSGYALLNDGTVSAWGMNQHGECGVGTTTNVLTPTPVNGLSGVRDVIGAGRNGFAVLNDGTLRAWGWNALGQIGDGTSGNDRLTPVSVVVPAEAGPLSLLPGNKQDHSVFIGTTFREVSGSNVALTATATASSTFSFRVPTYVNDGNPSTRWSSDYNSPTPDDQWLLLDFGGQRRLSRVVIKWETASAKEYVVELSVDGNTWTSIYSTTTGAGGNVDIPFTTQSARYIRMTGKKRNTSAGYSIWEFEAYA